MKKDKEIIFLIISLLIISSAFFISIYSFLAPSEQVIEVRIFDSVKRTDSTTIFTYNKGKFTLIGDYNFEEGSNYRIIFIQSPGSKKFKVISIEKLDGLD